MVKQTFKNLPSAKRRRIEAVLLEEFSTYPLADAKVSHIVKNANIARGAFYKYFELWFLLTRKIMNLKFRHL